MTTCPLNTCPLRTNRSSSDHRRFFGLVGVAYHHWPEKHDFQPDDEDHLRKWLLIKAGYRTITPIAADYAENQPALQRLVLLSVEGAVRAADNHAFVRLQGDTIYVFAAKSIAFKKLKRAEWNELRDKVEAVIANEMNMTAETLLKEHGRAA